MLMRTSQAVEGIFRTDLVQKHRGRLVELTPFVAFALVPVFGADHYALATQIAIYIIFAISLDLLIGYAGIITLGHSAYFGAGAYAAGIMATSGYGDPFLGLVVGALTAGALGAVVGPVILRTHGFTLLMLTLSIVFLLHEIANKATALTGGVDGLVGMNVLPIFGRFQFDLAGQVGFYYAVAVLLVVWIGVRRLVHAPIGQSVMALRDNRERSAMIGARVMPRLVGVYAFAGALAGLAGALQAHATQLVGLNTISFELSGEILVMLALGGAGRLYGAFVGPAVFLVARDILATENPVFWSFWLGSMIIIVVLFARGGVLGICDRVVAWWRLR